MPTTVMQQRCFDARPDRVDYRDREYQPPLVSLPERFPDPAFIAQHLPHYTAAGLILDQGQEGACTGFGLAAVINYLLWRRSLTSQAPVAPVSPRMLYHMARIYDEWPGEDYEGSSCRGAMKGWHRHGVCTTALWPYRTRGRGQFVSPKRGWQQDAATRPLGAYYRVNKDAISDLQAAIHEVGAIYASAVVHAGWFLNPAQTLPGIEMQDGETGGHAFALVGYTPEGFIVQNSWGPDWGYQGFAVLTYEDWIQHGTDAWVAVLGAPMTVRTTARTRSSMALRDVADGKAAWFWDTHSVTRSYTYRNPAVAPLSESTAYEHTVVLGNNGRPLNHFLDVADAQKAVQEVTLNLPRRWLSQQDTPKLALYAHGGLNNEETSIRRIRVMAPYFQANGIYPLFITWRTGFLESVEDMLGDVVEQLFTPGLAERERGWFSDVKQQIADARDRTIEVACEQLLVKAVWMQMKQNALAAQSTGLALMVNHLAALKQQLPHLELHLIGHSAGAILLGRLLDHLVSKQLQVATLSLYAPACTVRFALQHYVAAQGKRLFTKQNLHVDLLSDEREQADTVGPYGKSLLYLVSRSLEEVHKMPLLGMEGAWDAQVETPDMWQRDTQGDVKSWRQFAGEAVPRRVHTKERAEVWDGQEHVSLAHGSFDNDLEVVTTTLQRIRGSELSAAVENLHGF
jgi:hypothetical protein